MDDRRADCVKCAVAGSQGLYLHSIHPHPHSPHAHLSPPPPSTPLGTHATQQIILFQMPRKYISTVVTHCACSFYIYHDNLTFYNANVRQNVK